MRILAALAVAPLTALALASSAAAQVLVAGPNADANAFPFAATGIGANTRYQQVYRASAFPGLTSFNEIAFFPSQPGTVASSTFDVYVSTTSAAVDGLDVTDLDANLGANTAYFGTFSIGGPAGATLALVGTPYLYDPTLGNLLVDIRFTVAPQGGNVAYLGTGGVPGIDYSRAHDFGNGFAGYGLDTRFASVRVVAAPEPGTFALAASGLVAVAARVRRRRA